MRVLKKTFNLNSVLKKKFDLNSIIDCISEAKEATSKQPEVAPYLNSRLNSKSFFEDFLYYNSEIDNYVNSIGQQFIGLLETDTLIIREILSLYTKSIYENSINFYLFEHLYKSYIQILETI